MKTKKEIRNENFNRLIEEAGSISELARRCGYDNPASLYQLRVRLNKQEEGSRGITNTLSAKLENGMGKPRGWMDIQQQSDTAAVEVSDDTVPELNMGNASGRVVTVTRNTSETQITISLNLDGTGRSRFDTGVPFLEHMLDQIARHSLIDLDITCKGDLHIDDHHTVEDIGITLGQALKQALGDKSGIRRYGHAYVPLDEALSRVVIDLSGRPGLVYNLDFTRAWIGKFDVDLFSEFFHGLVNHSMMTLHIDNLSGINAHHQAETVFKAFGRALRMAVEYDPRMAGQMPSTKGTLTA
ncbi:imidazoleglycerol-phosphate dehydratase HisB [Neisseria canis]|uniref:Imidazoleglycerol-phosphate dehydratase n=1 Tax=Neisseria canis TaxID=493 RepID=A0A448D584_9NEIS|nr:imidazoleglycerol-phosphate dehydratase HisB [Neisseria canis]OSI11998.1 imidazoleglycerol-phosphate dehydratase [Neisseria canis]VEE98886.1 imidazoleglycerol-phosphate dehydratase (IGPD) [Neisseria canis]